MPDHEYKIGDVVYLSSGEHARRGVVCSVCHPGLERVPKQYRVAWDCVPPCPPELDPVGVWCRKYAADELARERPATDA